MGSWFSDKIDEIARQMSGGLSLLTTHGGRLLGRLSFGTSALW
jgi:hypothetical protein